MKIKVEKVTVFRVDGKDFESEEKANKYIRDKEKEDIYSKIFDIAVKSHETGEELLEFIGNLSNRELAIIRQMTHKN